MLMLLIIRYYYICMFMCLFEQLCWTDFLHKLVGSGITLYWPSYKNIVLSDQTKVRWVLRDEYRWILKKVSMFKSYLFVNYVVGQMYYNYEVFCTWSKYIALKICFCKNLNILFSTQNFKNIFILNHFHKLLKSYFSWCFFCCDTGQKVPFEAKVPLSLVKKGMGWAQCFSAVEKFLHFRAAEVFGQVEILPA